MNSTEDSVNNILEEFIEDLSVLPTHIQKDLQLLRQLDEKCTNIVQRTRECVISRDPVTLKDNNFIQKQFEEVYQLSEEKIQLSKKCYEEADKYIRRLDEQLAKFSYILSQERNEHREALLHQYEDTSGSDGGEEMQDDYLSPTVLTGSGRSGIAQIEEELPREKSSSSPTVVSTTPVIHQQVPSVHTNLVVANALQRTTLAKVPKSMSPLHADTLSAVPTTSRDASKATLKIDLKKSKQKSRMDISGVESGETSRLSRPHDELDLEGAPPAQRRRITLKNTKDKSIHQAPALTSLSPLTDIPRPGKGESAIMGPPTKQVSAGKGKLLPTGPPPIEGDMPVDPNEPVYCFCRRVSFGKMVACDNPECKREWFHFQCVGLTEEPKGSWYCSECENLMKKKKVK